MFHVYSLFLIHVIPCAFGYDSIKDLGRLKDFQVFKKAYEKIVHEDFENINIVVIYEILSGNRENKSKKHDRISFAISEQKNIKDINYVDIKIKNKKEEKIMRKSNMTHEYKIPESVSANLRTEMEKLKENSQCKYAIFMVCGCQPDRYILLDDHVQKLIQLIEEYHKYKAEDFRRKFKYLFWLFK